MAAAPPLVTVPAFDRLSLAVVNIKQTSSGYNGNNYTVLGEGEEVLLTLNEIVPDTSVRGGTRRLFQFNVMDNLSRKLFSFRRPTVGIVIPEKVKLFMNEALVSVVYLGRSLMTPIFNINDALDNPVIRLKGQMFALNYFELQTNDKTAIGGVQKLDRGWKKEMTSYKDDYIISFPAGLAVAFKLAVIVACVYIDFTFNEGN